MSSQMEEHVALLKAFYEAVDALNSQDIAKVTKLLHEDIVLNKIHDQTGTVRGKDKVVEFLAKKIQEHGPQLKPISPVSVDSRTDTVSGMAMWEDHEPEGDIKELVDYSFAFTFDANGWRIRNMYASPREPNKIKTAS
jgi:SnoaL-like domain